MTAKISSKHIYRAGCACLIQTHLDITVSAPLRQSSACPWVQRQAFSVEQLLPVLRSSGKKRNDLASFNQRYDGGQGWRHAWLLF